jgi:hypothetical protein
MESYMAKVDNVGLWDCKIHFGGLPQDSKVLLGCSSFNFFERGSWRQVLMDVSTTKLLAGCPSNHQVFVWCIFPVWPN